MDVRIVTNAQLAKMQFSPGDALVSMRDKDSTCAELPDWKFCKQFVVNDATADMPDCFDRYEARRMVEYLVEVSTECKRLTVHSDHGEARSLALVAALLTISGGDPKPYLRRFTHNRLLYKYLIEAAGRELPKQPMVSICIYARYPVDRLQSFMLSLKRQRYENWQAVVFTEGNRTDLMEVTTNYLAEGYNTKFFCATTVKGFWGSHYRQQALNESDGDIIGCNADDNWLTPGYIEQMAAAIEDGADLVLCSFITHYTAYQVIQPEPLVNRCDLGAWLARKDLVRQVPWPGTMEYADSLYVERLAQACGPEKITIINRPLYIHN